jgi:putative FmdB family regulatory protein
MPTYEYKCEACGHAFEKFQSMSSAPVRKCPVCGKLKVKRLIGAGAALIFKGSGFYITDYRSDAYNQAAKKDAPAAATADSSKPGDSKTADGKSAESKPEAKPNEAGKTPAAATATAESKPAASSSDGKASSGEGKSSSGEGKASSSASKTRTKSAKGKS